MRLALIFVVVSLVLVLSKPLGHFRLAFGEKALHEAKENIRIRKASGDHQITKQKH